MVVMAVVIVLAVLALVTQAGVYALERNHPSEGSFIDVKGARPVSYTHLTLPTIA